MTNLRELQKLFSGLVKSDALAHAYLFFGPGSRNGEAISFALSLARFVERADWEGTEVLLDTQVISGKAAGIAEIRSAIRSFWEAPLASRTKFLIIEHADELTNQAAQALLKTVEEPPAHGSIMLIAKDTTGMLPPLLSRLQRIYVGGVEAESLEGEDAARQLLGASTSKERTEILKALIEEETDLGVVVAAMLRLLRKKPLENVRLISALSKRWSNMERFTLNRKLQLEAAFAEGLR